MRETARSRLGVRVVRVIVVVVAAPVLSRRAIRSRMFFTPGMLMRSSRSALGAKGVAWFGFVPRVPGVDQESIWRWLESLCGNPARRKFLVAGLFHRVMDIGGVR